ncbi:hypothetical protein EKK70_17640, partial [Desulfovibrio sp. DS-1]
GRVLIVRDDLPGAPETAEITCGVPQGSVLGPLLWNVAYDAVLRLPMPRGTITVGYADDTLIVAEGDTAEAAQNRTNAALAAVSGHIAELGLRLAVEKTTAAVFGCGVWKTAPRIRLAGQTVETAETLKYLGITFSTKGSLFGAHLRGAALKAGRVMSSLGRLMPNVGGPREPRRRLLTGVVQSVLLYGAPTWAHTLCWDKPALAAMAAVHRRAAIRRVCAYRTVSHDAAVVVARTPPIDLLATERQRAFIARIAEDERTELAELDDGDRLRPPPAASLRIRTMARWSCRVRGWDVPVDSGRAWTRTLI